MTNNNSDASNKSSHIGLVLAGTFGVAGVALVAISTPFVLPALRKHCLPYVPATDNQLANLTRAFKGHAQRGDRFVDIGSGDGRICRLAHESGLFSQVHGVELNSLLVMYSRVIALKNGQFNKIKFHRQDLWKFPLARYDSICIFGVESMMDPLSRYIVSGNMKTQTIFACRFPFKNWTPIDEIGTGIDTVWIYKVHKQAQ